jgi:hypothetical protein
VAKTASPDRESAKATGAAPANHSARQQHLYAAVPAPSVPSAIVSQPSVGVYKPPPINSFSDRVTQCQHSFPLNAGLGNNPTNRDFYVRYCAN